MPFPLLCAAGRRGAVLSGNAGRNSELSGKSAETGGPDFSQSSGRGAGLAGGGGAGAPGAGESGNLMQLAAATVYDLHAGAALRHRRRARHGRIETCRNHAENARRR